MPAVRIGPKHQITIPRDVFDSLHLEVGDFLETQIRDNAIVLISQRLVPKDQEWFWTQEWQKMGKEADDAIRKGEVAGPFTKAADVIKALRK